MDNYLKEIIQVVELRGSDVDGIMIVNSAGIVEYYSHWGGSLSDRLPDFFPDYVAGRHLLEIYTNLDEKSSTVMQTLKTGQTTIGKKQVLNWKDYTMTIIATTYPIIEKGVIKGAVDAGRILSVTKGGVHGKIDGELYGLDDIITGNKEMIKLKDTIATLSNSRSHVMIYGETGTGKQLVAESIHSLSKWRNKPFISQNCAAIPENLLESLFFGTEKGGFTGAERRQGLFELANGGTLFLDEINSLSADLQGKLLKALEEQRIRPIGSNKDIAFDVRVISATNEDVEELLESGRMRRDLYYRIGVVKLRVPPLRERPEDIPLLIDGFIKMFNKKMNKKIIGISLLAEQMFEKWHWPGNVRELRNTIESAFNVERSQTITLNGIPEFLHKVNNPRVQPGNLEPPKIEGQVMGDNTLTEMLEEYEKNLITQAIKGSHNLNGAAKSLGISPQKLQYRLKKLGMRENKNT